MSNFDFNKAINGEPIYCNKGQMNISFLPSKQIFQSFSLEWDKNGIWLGPDNGIGNLTTDPPKKKVKKTVWIRVAQVEGQNSFFATNPNTKEYCTKYQLGEGYTDLGVHPIEIEVEG